MPDIEITPERIRPKMFFYVLTLQGSWNRQPTAQVTITGSIDNEKLLTRSQIFTELRLEAKQMWHSRYPQTSSDNFSVIFYSLEEDEIL